MSREIIDLETDTVISTTQNYKEKNYAMIDELNKKLRFIKFESDKKIKSLEEEIDEYKDKLMKISNQQNNKSYQQITMELEKNLTNAENELCNYRQTETDLKKQILNLKSENVSLRNDTEKIAKLLEDEKELEELRLLKQNIEEFQTKVKESAIETIIEKEKELELMRDKIQENDVFYQAQINSLTNEIHDLQEKLFKSGIFLRDSSDINMEKLENDNHMQEIEKMRQQFDLERSEMRDRFNILSNELEQQALNFEQQKLCFEMEITEKAHEKIKEQLEATSSKEYDLLEELQKYDDQIKNYELSTKELEKKLKNQEERNNKNIETYKKKIEELEKIIENKESDFKKQDKLGDKMKEMKQEMQGQIQENDNVIKSLEKLKEKDRQKILQLEGENKKYIQIIEKLKISQQNLELIKSDFEEKNKQILKENEELKSELIKSVIAIHKTSEDPYLDVPIAIDKSKHMQPRATTMSLFKELKGFEEVTQLEDTNPNNNFFSGMVTPNIAAIDRVKKMDFGFSKRKFSFIDKTSEEMLQKKIAQLETENENLKQELESMKQSLFQELEKQKNKEFDLTKQQQHHRRESLLGIQLIPQEILEKLRNEGIIEGNASALSLETFEKAFQQLERANSDKKELESKFYKLKREYEEEKIFLEGELKHAEEMAIDAKLQYAIIATEKDYFEHEHKIIVSELKKKKIMIEYDEKRKDAGILNILLCGCKS